MRPIDDNASIVVWHKVVLREPTEDERKEFLECEEVCPEYIFDCKMPDDGDEILIATAYGVDKDVCGIDDGYYLENYDEWDSVLAWAYLPKYEVSV